MRNEHVNNVMSQLILVCASVINYVLKSNTVNVFTFTLVIILVYTNICYNFE